MEWRQDAAPKDEIFLAVFRSVPWPLPCVWNGAVGMFVAPVPQCGLFRGDWDDWYFEDEQLPEKEILYWTHLPEGPLVAPDPQ